MAKAPKTVPELIEAFGGPTKFAEAIGLNGPSTASEMKRTGRISAEYWARIILEGNAREIPVTSDSLVSMHSKERVSPGQLARASA